MMEILEGNDEEIELSLGLSIGDGRSFKKFEKSNQEKSSSLTFEMKFLDQNDNNNNNNGLDLEKRKREIHKMRRQEAIKKRDIKKNGRKLPEFEQQEEDEQSSSFKKLKPENEEMDKEKGDIGYHHQYQMIPFWVPPPASTSSSSPETSVVDDKNVVQPIFIRPFHFSDSPPKDKISDSCGSAVVKDHQFDNETSSTRSAQSPQLNQPHHLHKSNNVQVQSENIIATSHPQTLGIKQDEPSFNKIIDSSNSITTTQSTNLDNKSLEEPISIPNSIPMIIKTELLPPLQQLKYKPPIPKYPRQSKVSNEDCYIKPPLPLSPKKVNDVETNQWKKEETNKSLPKMPCVSTVGDGPDGKTITGFLYRYTNAEVSIVCVCHGSSFSPAEFVKHAGRTDVSQPLKHIVVLPTPFS